MTEALTLDTSGRVEFASSFQPIGWAIWSDLDLFTQGYIEALFASMERWPGAIFGDPKYPALPNANGKGHTIGLGFSGLAPETLARIIADCAQALALRDGASACYHRCNDDGRAFWRERQTGRLAPFESLAPYLGDDGKVYLRESPQ